MYGNRCAFCLKKTSKLTKDHLYPKSKGGGDGGFNVAPACEECNLKKGSGFIWSMING